MTEAVIISIDEPQLERCLESVKRQTIPFSNIIHVNGVIPESTAFNCGIQQVLEDWAMFIGGDFILYDNAVEIATGYMNGSDKVCGYCFGLYDSFLDCNIGFCNVLRTSVYKSLPCPDKLSSDRKMNYAMRKMGWKLIKFRDIILGTHFDRPDEFQVFRRFYSQTIKYMDGNYVRDRMGELLEKTGDPLYSVGIKTIDFAREKKVYPGSKNLDFDKEMYEEFRRLN